MVVRRRNLCRNLCRHLPRIQRIYVVWNPCLILGNVALLTFRSPEGVPPMEWVPARLMLRRLCLSRHRLLMPHVSILSCFSFFAFLVLVFVSFLIVACVVNWVSKFLHFLRLFTVKVLPSLHGVYIRNRFRISREDRGAGSCLSLHR